MPERRPPLDLWATDEKLQLNLFNYSCIDLTGNKLIKGTRPFDPTGGVGGANGARADGRHP